MERYRTRFSDDIVMLSEYGNLYVEVDTYNGGWSPFGGTFKGEHHMTNRARARRAVHEFHGLDYDVLAYVGLVHYRRADGTPATARRYSVGRIG